MATNRSDKSRWPSNYGGGWISAPQYLAECLCVLIAKQRREELSDKFWNKPEWKKTHRWQVILASRLLKEYPAEVILSALRDRRCRDVRSLGARWKLDPILLQKKREHDIVESHKTQRTMEQTSTVQKPRRIKTGKKSMFAQLKEAE